MTLQECRAKATGPTDSNWIALASSHERNPKPEYSLFQCLRTWSPQTSLKSYIYLPCYQRIYPDPPPSPATRSPNPQPREFGVRRSKTQRQELPRKTKSALENFQGIRKARAMGARRFKYECHEQVQYSITVYHLHMSISSRILNRKPLTLNLES